MQGKTLTRLAEVLRKGLDADPIGPKERDAIRAAAENLFPGIEAAIREAFRRRGHSITPRVSLPPESRPETLTCFASLGFDLSAPLGLDHPSWQGLELGVYFGYDATGFRDRLVWGVSGYGDKEWVERSVGLLRPKRRSNEPFLRTGEPLFAGGEFGWYVLWAWDRPADSLAEADDEAVRTEVRSRLEQLVGRLVPSRSRAAASNGKKRG